MNSINPLLQMYGVNLFRDILAAPTRPLSTEDAANTLNIKHNNIQHGVKKINGPGIMGYTYALALKKRVHV